MLGIIRLNDSTFRVQANSLMSSELDMKEVFQIMLGLEAQFEEVELAISELVVNKHNLANFGVNRRFIYSV